MLIQFNFKNYRSFRDDTIIDLSATKISEYNDRVIDIGNERLLCVGAIFGANASGKSNIQMAFRYMCNYVIDSFSYGGDISNGNKSKFVKPTPFLMDNKSKNSESVFEVYFIGDESNKFKSYNYGFSVDHNGVKEEWLNTKSKTSRGNFKNIFYRNRDDHELDLNGLPKVSQQNIITALEDETLVVSLGAKLKIDILKYIRDWFLNHEIADYGNPLENFVLSRYIPKGFADNRDIQENVLSYLSTFDNSIIDFKVEKNNDHINIYTIHKIIDSDEVVEIPLNEESAGTLKMFSLYPSLHSVMNNGGILFVDELNSRLHPLLVRNFLISFLNPNINKKHAQIIFTTHDSWMLSNNLLRRDEIWFVDKNNQGVSSLYSLADFEDEKGVKIRKDENFEKNYLLGKYGAVPILKSIIVKDD